MRSFSCLLAPALLLGLLLASGCGNASPAEETAEPFPLSNGADSMAMRMYRAQGGPEVWEAVPALAFSFAVGQAGPGGDTTRREVARHWWRRADGKYRVEWSNGPDSAYAAAFDVDEFDLGTDDAGPLPGHAVLNGARLDSAAEQRALRQAGTRFANDTYWLLAPLKLFDGGVNRSLAADPAEDTTDGGGSGEVLHLSFEKVGITDRDRYWLTPDSTTGRLARWTFALQGMGPEQPPGVFRWTSYETFSTPAGALMLSTQKENVGGPSVIYTDEISVPATLPDSLFSVQ